MPIRPLSYSFSEEYAGIIAAPHTPLSMSTWTQMSPCRIATGLDFSSMSGAIDRIRASLSNELLFRRLICRNHYVASSPLISTDFPFVESLNTAGIISLIMATTSSKWA